MLKYISILLFYIIILTGCPHADPVDLGPIPGPPHPTPTPWPVTVQQCKLQWNNGVSFDNYDTLIASVIEQLAVSTCTAEPILCIPVGIGTPCERVWEFKTMDDIPRHTITDECGNNVIYYLEEDNL
jgi:hypothetical protein